MKKVCICLISTGKYGQFVQPLIDSIREFFLLRHRVEIHLFSDDVTGIEYENCERVKIIKHGIKSYKFPEVTLYRYKIILMSNYICDYMYYMDVDMRIVREVGEEIFAPLVAVGHPGYSIVGGGAWCDNVQSLAYVAPNKRIKYVAGGFQGGQKDRYLDAIIALHSRINLDESRGIMATWHDESHWNKLYSEHPLEFLVLNSGYCMVENMYQRKLWKIDGLTPYILALDKNHKEIRE